MLKKLRVILAIIFIVGITAVCRFYRIGDWPGRLDGKGSVLAFTVEF